MSFAEETLSDIGGPVNLAQVKGSKKTKSFPFIAECMAKLADFEGTTLKPERSGKCDMCDMCDMCLKEVTKAEQECITQPCVGDEICIANQDLVIALDGSGSLREDGFNTLKSYALDLLSKYHSQYYGAGAMNIGLIEFGNGIIMPDGGTVSLAMNVHTISSDLDSVKSSTEGMVQKKGFTNKELY